MKGYRYILFFLPLVLSAQLLFAQDQASDLSLPLSYDPAAVLEDWKLWKAGQRADAVLQDFMRENEVPQTGQYGLTLDETWYWWISTNPEKIGQYLASREEE